MLAVPLAGQFEQEMNAFYLERLGFGTAAAGLDAGALERFLKHVDDHAEALGGYEQDGNTAALEAVDRTIEELVAALARPRRRRERPSVGDDAPGGTGR
jgi:hypothetical protein